MNNKIRICYDGTLEGFMSAVFIAYDMKLTAVSFSVGDYGGRAGEIFSETNPSHSKRVLDGLTVKVGRVGVRTLIYAFCSSAERKDEAIFEYIKLIFEVGMRVCVMKNNETVDKIRDYARKVELEENKTKRYLRFIDTEDGLVAIHSPQNDVSFLVIPHYVKVFGGQKFAIVDGARQKACIFDGRTYFVTDTSNLPHFRSSEEFAEVWRNNSAFDSAQVIHPTMLRYMPTVFWE